AARRLHQRVVAGAPALRPRRPVRADRRVDEPGVPCAERVGAEPELLCEAGPQALHEDVGAVGERAHDLRAAPQVERERALAGVGRDEERAVAVDERRTPRARLVAAERLDLDDVRAQRGEELRAVGPRVRGGHVDDTEPAERRERHSRDYRHPHAGHREPINRLAGETSPYLLQHADNPGQWLPWGEEAFARARAEDRPILLSVGYAACHWCHVMAHESFEDEETAALMNERFVNVKVDREERPDLDSVYMDAVVAMTGHGGWPMTVFLLPDGEPFLGGTYFPPEPRHGMPAFRQVLVAVSDAYRERRDDVGRQAAALVGALQQRIAPSAEPLTDSLLSEAVRGLSRQFDPEWGGFGGAPKFPPASTLEFLLRMYLRNGDENALAMAAKPLDAMAAGGMYDLLGGGFHRYSVDERWLVPHFEKMLYDNALLAPA